MSFVAEVRERTRPVLPLAAMVDVLFLLLIFFMTASVYRERELQIPIDAPAVTTGQAGTTGGRVIISATAEGQVYLGAREVTLVELREALQELAAASPDDVVVVRVDEGGQWGQGMELVDIARAAGFTEVEAAVVSED